MRTTISRRTALKCAAATNLALAAALSPLAVRATTSRAMVEPDAGSWRTWFLAAGSEVRLPPPPDNREELAQVQGLLGSVDPGMADRIAFWDAGAPPYRWNEIAHDLFFRNRFSSDYGRILAYLNLAIHDATVAAWDSKYTYNRPRPSELDSSLNPSVAVPASPAYPSEHAAAAGAASEVLAYFAATEAETLRSMAKEAAFSRVWAGVQYASDSAAGLDLGRAVATRAIAAAKADNYDTAKLGRRDPRGPGAVEGQGSGRRDRPVLEAADRPLG